MEGIGTLGARGSEGESGQMATKGTGIVWSDVSQWTLEVRQERSRRTLHLILDAALKLFMAKGYEGTSVVDIATEAGLSPGALYRRFADKDAVLYTVINGYYDARRREFDEFVAQQIEPAASKDELLALYVEIIFSAYRNDPGLARLVQRRALVDASVRRRVLQNARHVSDRIAECLARHDPRPVAYLKERMAGWHDVMRGALVLILLPDEGEPRAHLSLADSDFQSDMLNAVKGWLA
ncbi:TetR/AcrR family transcriptional regulator [Rhizorhabdus dicambivorans]|uniref:TetR/AcrR family transcriptional regulator n=1 Tax=Rhizorhabdus dicambivorans TaxID=1850238 RepID=A0A2A4FYA0_9SPHN|nr:TetR/AcrR family transcriptional regulator [Rhizorhabdus dicambivorans]ATE63580.1 TetR/AcrR family transcriptional regulator [Rhizorhabdus dicambivorans]PCE42705.1 TetR/AcrR family transcriptional regulator [Rhizorhabdus dicambivorans]